MALVFTGDALSPARCAVDLAKGLRRRGRIKLRMGVHSGPTYFVTDINQQFDVSGEGIVTAARVMDCGDDGHILLSNTAAANVSKESGWAEYLTDLGNCEIKHGQRVHIYNLVTKDVGNRALPKKLFTAAAVVVDKERARGGRGIPAPIAALGSLFKLILWTAAFVTVVCVTLWYSAPSFRQLAGNAYPALKPYNPDLLNGKKKPVAASAKSKTGNGHNSAASDD